MSIADTMVPLVAGPWLDAAGRPLPVAALPGLSPEAIQGLEASFPGTLNPSLRELLRHCCGLAGTELGSIDFTGRWFPEEPLAVLRPCLTLAIDEAGRRWIAETAGGSESTGPVWCVFPDPKVAVFVADRLATFLAALKDAAIHGRTRVWMRALTAQARTVWSHRHQMAAYSHDRCRTDSSLRSWLWQLPFDAYVYDLRSELPARGWPYGLAGYAGRLFRCGRLPVFAVAGWPPSSGRMERRLESVSEGAAADVLAHRARAAQSSFARTGRGHRGRSVQVESKVTVTRHGRVRHAQQRRALGLGSGVATCA